MTNLRGRTQAVLHTEPTFTAPSVSLCRTPSVSWHSPAARCSPSSPSPQERSRSTKNSGLCSVDIRRALFGLASPASHCIVPETRLRIAPLRREGFSRTTPDAVEHCQQRNGPLAFHLFGKQTYQCDVNLPWPRNLFLALVEKFHKFLSALFWQGLGETRTKTVCSQPCRLVHRGKRFVQVLKHDLGQVLICLRTLPSLPGLP